MKHWSSTQQSISLSSGEAEFAGVIRGAGHGLGYQAMLRDLGVEVPLRVWTDSSAAMGICTRQGRGKLRHLDTHTLWIQQAVRTQRVDLRKVDGEQNPADLLTKHSISRHRLESLVRLFGCTFLEGRAASAPQVRKGTSDKTTMAQADSVLSTTDHDAAVGYDSSGPEATMPHLIYSEDELNKLYPTLDVPEEENLDDVNNDEQDMVFRHGLRVAAQIQRETELQGRRRRPNQEEKGGEVGNLGVLADELHHHRADEPPGEKTGDSPPVSRISRNTNDQHNTTEVALLERKPADSPSGLRRSDKKNYLPPPQSLQPPLQQPRTTTTATTTTTTTLTRTSSFASCRTRASRACPALLLGLHLAGSRTSASEQ